ncbi:MAG: hypothetical protein QW063_02265 [Candidatus Nanoarchaeia archaeon]
MVNEKRKYNVFTPLRRALRGGDGAAPSGWPYLGQTNNSLSRGNYVNCVETTNSIVELYGTYETREKAYRWRIQVFETKKGTREVALYIEGNPFSLDSEVEDEVVRGIKDVVKEAVKGLKGLNIPTKFRESLQDKLK